MNVAASMLRPKRPREPIASAAVRVPLLCSTLRGRSVDVGPRAVDGCGIDYRQVRSRVPITAVLALADWWPRVRRGEQLRGPCPIHRSGTARSRSFSVNLARNIYRCFVCGSSGNPLDLWMHLTGQPLYAASIDLCRRLGVDIPYLQPDIHPRRPTNRKREEEPVINH